VRTGEHFPSDIAAGAAIGAGAALLTRRVWPVAPHTAAATRPTLRHLDARPLPDGTGVEIVVNPSAGPAIGRDPSAQLRDALPAAKIVPVADGDDLAEALERAARSADVVGVCGGDGSVNAAASVAVAHDRPLLVVPGGTLNHFARDLGLATVDDAIGAVQDGGLAEVDLGLIGGRPFLNTASFGAYPELVDTRERLERRIGKWPALVVALIRVLWRAEPCDVEIDGVERRVWMSFIGNCRYHPAGFAPSWRERLDDGLFDVRLVDAHHPFSRTRLVLAVLSGRLGRCRAYEQRAVRSIRVRSRRGPLRLAADGETFDGPDVIDVDKAARRLVVVTPAESGA
jgi:undecaprenyl-diphosphatase